MKLNYIAFDFCSRSLFLNDTNIASTGICDVFFGEMRTFILKGSKIFRFGLG